MLEGQFDFNKTPMAPPGTRILIHEKPGQRASWDPHGAKGWYLGPAMEHYRCYRVYTNKTRAERYTDTVEFFPQHTQIPFRTPAEIAEHATNELIRVINNPTPSTPFAHVPDNQQQAIQRIADIFHKHLHPNTPTPPRVVQSPRMEPSAPPQVPMSPMETRTTSATLPRVTTPTVPPPHRYPTRHIISQTQDDEANHIQLQATQPLPSNDTQHWANAIIDAETGAAMEYRHLVKSPKHCKDWTHSFANELGRLAQGVGGREKGTDTIFFIAHAQIPQERRKDVTYGRICVDYRPQKTEPKRTRLTVGGNLIDFPGDVSTPTADTTTAKLVINSTISTKGARYMIGDIKNFYLGTPMTRYEYMRLPIAIVPPEIIEEYNLMSKIHNEFIYIEI